MLWGSGSPKANLDIVDRIKNKVGNRYAGGKQKKSTRVCKLLTGLSTRKLSKTLEYSKMPGTFF